MNTIENEVINYWSKRASSYSESTQETLSKEDEKTAWKHLIYSKVEENKKLKILDIGTGPGVLAILLASNPNFTVLGVDSCPEMLKQAQKNATKEKVNVAFQESDAHQLPFKDEFFDIVISKCVTWNLPQPKNAYKEWKRVLKKGGKMLNFDANWYLRLHNEELQKKYNEIEQYEKVPAEMRKKMEDLARGLPLSKKQRPIWDVETLLSLNFKEICINPNINKLVFNNLKQKMYESTPMFMITTIK